MTRYAERDALRSFLVKSENPYALELAELLRTHDTKELVPITPVSATNLLPTYERRLEIAASGVGPPTRGLSEFVAALRDQNIAEMFALGEGGTTSIGLINESGDIAAVTFVGEG